MTLLTHLHRTLASALGRSSRTDPRAIGWIQRLQGHYFSSSSDSDGPSTSDGDSSSDDERENSPKTSAAEASASPKEVVFEAETYDPTAEFAALGAVAASQTEKQSIPAAKAWHKIDGGFPVSEAFDELVRSLENMTEDDVFKLAEEEEAIRHGNKAAAFAAPEDKGAAKLFRPLQRATEEDFLVLAEAIEAYLSVAPVSDPRRDGIGNFERAILAGMATHFRSEYGDGGRSEAMPPELAVGSPLEKRVVNMAPPGRLGWEILGVDEERGVVHWAVDLTDGKAPDPWRNGLLSDHAKNVMYDLHKRDPKQYSVEALAKAFKVRQQRIMAILALKELEAASPDAQDPEAEELRSMMEGAVWGCIEATGSGERHVVTVPSYPAYAQADTAAVMSRLEAAVGKPSSEITDEDLTPEIAQQVLGVKPHSVVEEELAAAEEANLVEEFKRALDFNMGKTGTDISRGNRRHAAPKRPEEGWSLTVTPLGPDAAEPYIAQPDGSRRPLNPDEALLVERKTPRPRRKVV